MTLTVVSVFDGEPLIARDETGKLYDRTSSSTWVEAGAHTDGDPDDNSHDQLLTLESLQQFGEDGVLSVSDDIALAHVAQTEGRTSFDQTEYHDDGSIAVYEAGATMPNPPAAQKPTKEWTDALPGLAPAIIEKIQRFALSEQEQTDSIASGLVRFQNSLLAIDILSDIRTADPASYDRANAIKKLEVGLAMANVPSNYDISLVLKVGHVIRLHFSDVDAQGQRSYRKCDVASFGVGNCRFNAVLEISRMLTRQSESSEMDVFEYGTDAKAALASSLISALQAGSSSVSKVRAKISDFKARTKNDRLAADNAKKTAETLLAEAQRKKNREIAKVGEAAHEALSTYTKLTGGNREDFESLLRSSGVLPARETIEQLTDRLTSGDVKAIVQRLHAQKSPLFGLIILTVSECAKQDNAKQSPATLPISAVA